MFRDRRDRRVRKNNTDRMKFFVLIISSGMFSVSVLTKLLSPARSDIRDVTTVFIIVCGFVFGSNIANLFINRDK